MASTTGPYDLVAGQSQALPMPGNSPWESFTLSNLSPLLLQLNIDGSQYWLAPWTENLYGSPSSHNPPTIIPSIPTGVTISALSGAQAQVTWYPPGQSPQGAWPLPLLANALAAAIAGLNFTDGNLDINVNAIEGTPPLVGALFVHALTMAGSGSPVQGPNQAVLRGVTMITDGDNADGIGLGASSGAQPVGLAPGSWGPSLPVTNCNLLFFEGTIGDVVVLIGV